MKYGCNNIFKRHLQAKLALFTISACLLVEETDGKTPSSRGHVTHVTGGTAANLTDAAATVGHISIRHSSRVSECESADFTLAMCDIAVSKSSLT